MKKNLIKQLTCLTALGAGLAGAAGVARADIITYYPPSLNDGSSGPWSLNAWGGQGGGSIIDTGVFNSPASGSVYIVDDWSAGDQLVDLGWYSGAWGAGTPTNLLLFTNIVYDVLWDAANSSMEMDDFNNCVGAPGGENGLVIYTIGSGNSWITMGQPPLPDGASNGWTTVRLPINPTIAGIDQSQGIGFKKWVNSGHTGYVSFWVSNIGYEGSGTPPLPPTMNYLTTKPVVQGLNIYDDGAANDRQSFATVSTNNPDYGWIGNPSPVSYHVTVAASPTNASYQTHIMIAPGNNVTEGAPDWNEANCMVWFIEAQADGSALGFLRYKIGDPANNDYLFGGYTNVFGGQGLPFTNMIVAGYGGLLGQVTNAAGVAGTWTMTFSDDTNIVLQAPDGTTVGCYFPIDSDATTFASPVTVYWGAQANSTGVNGDLVMSGAGITGSATTLPSPDLSQPLDPLVFGGRWSNQQIVFPTPLDAVYWLQWSLPDVDYHLYSAPNPVGPWALTVGGPDVHTTNLLATFADATTLSGARTYNPPPIWVGQDGGSDVLSSTTNWVAGPTLDANGSAGSGSIELQWVWDTYTAADGMAWTWDLEPSAVDCTGGTLSFDIRIDGAGSTAGLLSDYGFLQVITRNGSYAWQQTSYGSSVLTSAGGAVDQWATVSIPLDNTEDQVRALTFQILNDDTRMIAGPEQIYIDNIQLTKVVPGVPTLYSIGGLHSCFVTTPMLPSSGAGCFQLRRAY